MKQRFAPFLVLLEARYAPLLFAVAPQAYAIYLWLFPRPYDGTGEFFAVIGALGYEFIYVGAIAWAEDGKAGRWTWTTAAVALVFSIAVAIFVYQAQGLWSVLHAGFPLVAFGYTMQLHGMTKREQPSAAVSTAQTTLEPASERLGAPEAADAGTDAPRQIQAVGQAPELDGDQVLLDHLLTTSDLPYASEQDSLAALDGGIYAIENTASGRIYIGSTVCFEKRRRAHRRQLVHGTHNAFYMQRDWNACTEPVFVFRILEEGTERLLEREQLWINEMTEQRGVHSLYNTDVADVPVRNGHLRLEISPLPIAEMSVAASQLKKMAYTYSCPHCGQALTSKQALGAAVKNGYCLGCKRRTA